MASNPPYILRNITNEVLFFGLNHQDNYANSVALKPGQYMSFTDLSKEYYLSSDFEEDRFRDDLFRQVGKTLTLTDKDGNSVTPAQYKTDNP